jgi:hypothetical protein
VSVMAELLRTMKNILFMGHALVFTLAMTLTAGISADSPCKGLSESECSSNDKCTWVKAYSQKDGDKVKAHCRAKPGQGDSDKSGKKANTKKEKSDEAVKADDDKSAKKDKKNKDKKKDKADAKEDKKDDSKSEKKAKKDKKDSKEKKKSKKDE